MQLSLLGSAVAAALLLALPASAHEPYRVDLVPCTETLCEVAGAAPLHEGRVEVDEHGDVEVELHGGPASAALCLRFQAASGGVEAVGGLETDALGHADAIVGAFETGVFMGLFRLHEGTCEAAGAPLFVTAFSVGVHDDDDDAEKEYEHGARGEDDNDGDGIPNDEDPDDDNDGIPDVDDPDDDNDGIPDELDADPDDANPFDDDDVDEAKDAYKAERRALKDDYKSDVSELRNELRREVEDLREDLEDRLDD